MAFSKRNLCTFLAGTVTKNATTGFWQNSKPAPCDYGAASAPTISTVYKILHYYAV
jgi:hypothetical protein